MRIANPIQMNDWEIKKFLRIVLSIQVALWGISAWDTIGLDAGILRALVGFIYLSYVPGIVVLRALRLHGLGNIKTLLFAVGLSLSIVMLIGLLLNTIFDALSLGGPISAGPVIAGTSLFVIGSSAVAYLRDSDYAEPRYLDLREIVSPPALLLFLLPVLVILGVYEWDYFESNFLLMASIFLIAVTAALAASGKVIPTGFYPLAVTAIAVSLLYHTWLLSSFIWGRDIHSEFYYADSVLLGSRWNPGLFSSTNAMLGIVMLAPIYSLVLGLDLTWTFKLVYPTLFALIPLGLFWVFREQFDDRTAFLACFLFMTMGFYEVWLLSAKQLTAELFLVLIVVLLMYDRLSSSKRAALSVTFGFSLVVTHYGTFYIVILVLVIAWLTLTITRRRPFTRKSELRIEEHDALRLPNSRLRPLVAVPVRLVRVSFILLLFVGSVVWYAYVARATAFNDVVRVGRQVLGSSLTEFLNPSTAQGAQLLLAQAGSLFGYVLKITILATQVLIAMGVVVLIFSIVLPYFASAIYSPRLYNIGLVFLAPFVVTGGLFLLRTMRAGARARLIVANHDVVITATALLVVTVFLFGTGFASEIGQGPPFSDSLSGVRMMHSPDPNDRARFYYDVNVFGADVRGAEWLHDYGKAGSLIYNDSSAAALTSYGLSLPYVNRRLLTDSVSSVPSGAYVYLDYSNVVGGVLNSFLPSGTFRVANVETIDPLLSGLNKVYSNGGDSIFYASQN